MNSGLPKTWATTEVGAITIPVEQRAPQEPETFVYVDISSIDGFSKQVTRPKMLDAANAPSRARQRLRQGDVVVSMTRPNLNAVAQIPPALDGSVGSTGFHVIRPVLVESRWLYYFVRTDDFVRHVSSLVQGVVYPAIRPLDLHRVLIPIPPLAEQHRIVAEIEKQLTRIDAAVAALERTRTSLKRYRAAVLQAAVEGHPVVRTGDVLREKPSNGRSVPDAANGFPVLRLTALRSGRLDISQRKIGAWGKEEALPFLVEKDDFFVARGNGSLKLVGRGGLLLEQPDEVAFPDTLIRMRPKLDEITPQFLALVWESHLVRTQIETSARTTAGIYKINQQDLMRIEIPRPSLQEQEQIVNAVGLQLEICDSVERATSSALKRADRLRQSVLKHAFEGRLVPQDPNDEPASVLLERIRAEPAAAPAAKRRGRAPKAARQMELSEGAGA